MTSTMPSADHAMARPPQTRSASVLVWLGLIAYLALVKVGITLFPAVFRSAVQAVVFDWPFLAIWGLGGLVGIYFARKTGFPDAWDARVSTRQRFLIPAVVGLLFSVPFVAIDLLTHFTASLAAQHGQVRQNIDLPAALAIYPGGAIIVEVLYRLLLVPLLLWLISSVMLKQRGHVQVFWLLALLTSLIEPLTQDLDLAQFGLGLAVTVFALDYGFNLTQAVLFRTYGFLAAIIMRVAFYAVWHVLYIH